MIRHRSPGLRLENHTITQKEEEVPEGDNMLEGILFLEEEEEELYHNFTTTLSTSINKFSFEVSYKKNNRTTNP